MLEITPYIPQARLFTIRDVLDNGGSFLWLPHAGQFFAYNKEGKALFAIPVGGMPYHKGALCDKALNDLVDLITPGLI